MRQASLILCLLMILFAVVQLNDPDPALWVAIYGYTALIAFMGFRQRFYPVWAIAGGVAFLGGGLYLLPTEITSWFQAEKQTSGLEMTLPFVEEGREAMGLFICALVMGFHLAQKRRAG